MLLEIFKIYQTLLVKAHELDRYIYVCHSTQ
jgi:hypothetical protein